MERYSQKSAEEFLSLLQTKDACLELRCLGLKGEKPLIGFFDDIEKLSQAASSQSGKRNIYVGLNPRTKSLLGPRKNTLSHGQGGKTEHIVCRRWFPIDIDTKRIDKKAPATQKELSKVKVELFDPLLTFLLKKEISPIRGMSGNGYHCLIPVDYPNTEEVTDKFKKLLHYLAHRFNSPHGEVDISVYDAPRIWKLYGTLAMKGESTSERPWRMAQFESPKEKVEPYDLFTLFEKEIEIQSQPRPQTSFLRPNGKNSKLNFRGDLNTLDLVSLFQNAGLYRRSMPEAGKHSVTCPWESAHSTGHAQDTSTVIWESDGDHWPNFHCSHSHCQHKKIEDVLDFFGPEAVDRQCQNEFSPNRQAKTLLPPQSLEKEPDKNQEHEAKVKEWLESEDRDVRVILEDLKALPKISFELYRQAIAKKAGIRASILDEEVKGPRSSHGGNENTLVSSMIKEIEVYPEPVEGKALFEEVRNLIQTYIVLKKEYASAVTLWIFFSHGLKYFDINPRLYITGPEKGCGKSTLLSIVGALTPKSLSASNSSPAAIFRAIDKWAPTLIIDEADAFFKQDEDLRSILNSGHTPSQAFALRVVGEQHEPKPFSTWTPIAMAGIGKIWSTLEDRSIIIELQRKIQTEQVQRLRLSKLYEEGPVIASKLSRWLQDHGKTLDQDIAIPEYLSNRAADNWRPLFAIADLLGLRAEAEQAAQAIHSVNTEDGSIRVQLLADIQMIFEQEDSSRIHTQDLIRSLCEIEESPWGDWKHGRAITPQGISRLLKPFGIAPKQIRIGSLNKNGYDKEDFENAFIRYLPGEGPPQETREEPIVEEIQKSVEENSKSELNHFKPVEAVGSTLGVGNSNHAQVIPFNLANNFHDSNKNEYEEGVL